MRWNTSDRSQEKKEKDVREKELAMVLISGLVVLLSLGDVLAAKLIGAALLLPLLLWAVRKTWKDRGAIDPMKTDRRSSRLLQADLLLVAMLALALAGVAYELWTWPWG